MKSLKVKITLLSSTILIVTMVLLTCYSIFNSNNQFVDPLLKSDTSNSEKQELNKEIMISKISDELDSNEQNNAENHNEIRISYNVREAQKSFGYKQVLVMLFIVIGGITLTYIMILNTLKSLVLLDKTAIKIDENNLDTEIELPKARNEVYSLTNSFNVMLSRLKNAFEIQKNFAQNAAHELKTPLTVIKSSIQVLELDDNPTVEEYKENLTIIKKSTNELIQIVNQLLELTNNIEPQKQEIDVYNIMFECLNDYVFEIKQKSITTSIDIKHIKIYSNFSLLRSIISNIISNAVKYNKEKGSIYISAYKKEKNIEIVIKDTGIGIISDNLQHIFETFYREDHSRSKNIEGNGLGLAIVKSACQKLDGDININSEVNKGTIVTLEFQIDRSQIKK